MTSHVPAPDAANGTHNAASTVDDAMASTRLAARHALDSLTDAVQGLRDATRPLIEAGSSQVGDLAQEGMHEWQRRSRQLRRGARRAGDRTVHYIQDEPVKAVLIAAASGAVLMALAGLLMSARHRD